MKPSWRITLPFIFYIHFPFYFPASCHKKRRKSVDLSSHLNENPQFVSSSFPLPTNPSLIPWTPLGPFLALPHWDTNRNFHWVQPISNQDSGIPQARLAGQVQHTPNPKSPPAHGLCTKAATDTLQFLEFSFWGFHLIQIIYINNAHLALLGGWFSITHSFIIYVLLICWRQLLCTLQLHHSQISSKEMLTPFISL